MLSMTTREREGAIRELRGLAEIMVQGTLTRTTRTCGQASCRCHRGERHGPHTYLSFRTPEGRSSSLYVPPTEVPRLEAGVAAWRRFRELASLLGAANRAALGEGRGRARQA
jgi:hypothetical protein